MPESHRPSKDVVVCTPWTQVQQTVSPVAMKISLGEKKLLRTSITTVSALATPAQPTRNATATTPTANRANQPFIGVLLSGGSRRLSGRTCPPRQHRWTLRRREGVRY